MPLINHNQVLQQLDSPEPTEPTFTRAQPEEGGADSLYFPEQVAAAVINSPIGAPIAYPRENNYTSGYDFYSDIKGTPYEMYPDYFIGSGTVDEVNKRKTYIDIQNQISSDTSDGTGMLANMVAGLADPMTLLPGSVVLKSFKGSLGVAKSAIYGAASGATIGGWQGKIYENYLHDYTTDDTIAMVAGGAVLGGILGGGVGALSRDVIKETKRHISDVINNKSLEAEFDIPNLEPRSAGAAEALDNPNASKAAGGVEKAFKFTQVPGMRSPTAEVFSSESPMFRKMGSEIFENNFITNRNLEGIANRPAIETLIKRDRAYAQATVEDLDNFYVDYMRSKPGAFEARNTPMGKQPSHLKLEQFEEEVAKALRRNDEHEIAHVSKAAKRVRAEINRVNKELEKQATDTNSLKMFTKEVQEQWKVAGGQEGFSYLTRIFDKGKILKDRPKLEKTIEDYLISSGKTTDRNQAKTLAREEVDTRLGIGDEQVALSDVARMSLDKGVKFSKERSELLKDMPDTLLEPWLSNKAFQIAKMYSSQGSRLARVQEYLNELGVQSPRDLSNLLKAEYDTALVKNPKQAEKLARNLVDDVEKINDYMAIMLGQYLHRTKADGFFSNLMKYNYVTKLGGVLWSSIQDLAQPIFKMGMKGTIEDAWLNGHKQFNKVVREMIREDLNDMGMAIERANNNVLTIINGSSFEEEGIQSTISMFSNKVTHHFSRLSMIDQWTDFNRTMIGYANESRLVRAVNNFDNIAQDEKIWLAKLGISEREVKGISAELKKHSVERNGAFIADTKSWNNREMADIFSSAIIKETDSTIIMKGAGDIPRVVQRYKLAQALFQFKPYLAGFTNRTLLPALQEANKAKVYMGLMSTMMLGSMSYAIKETIAGREVKTDPTTLFKEGFLRGGVGGLIMDPMFGIILKPSISASRYGDSSATEYLLGPSASIFKNMYKISADTQRLEWTENTAEAAWRLVPFNNLFYLQAILSAGTK